MGSNSLSLGTAPSILAAGRKICNSNDRNSRSGAIDGRPTSEYNFANCGDISFRISSTILRIGRKG